MKAFIVAVVVALTVVGLSARIGVETADAVKAATAPVVTAQQEANCEARKALGLACQ